MIGEYWLYRMLSHYSCTEESWEYYGLRKLAMLR